VNAPAHAWATLLVCRMDKNLGREDVRSLERWLQRLMMRFDPWVVRRDPDGDAFRLRVRSMVGLLLLHASTVVESSALEKHPRFRELIALFRKGYPELVAHVAPAADGFVGYAGAAYLPPLSPAPPRRRGSAPRG